jgi:N-acetylmuramoyl-L-alanine amidase CwlA
MVGKPPVVWRPADWSNYTVAYREAAQIRKVVIHTTLGSYSSAIDWFQTPGAEVSAGTWHMNRTSLGIEHEGYFHDPVWFTTEMYRSSARLVAYLCRWYGIPIDSEHIIGHYAVTYTECPGPWWWWDYYMKLVWRYAWG